MSDQTFERAIDRVVRDHVAELQQEVLRLNDENNARRERWEALEDYVQREQPYNDAHADEFERGARAMAQIVLARMHLNPGGDPDLEAQR